MTPPAGHRAFGTIEHWSALACVIVAAVLVNGPYLLRADLFFDDAAHHIFWTYRYADPLLFPGDPTVPYFLTSAPWGYRGLYALLASAADPLQAGEFVAVGLLFASAWLAWRVAIAVSGAAGLQHGLLAVAALIVLLPLSVQQDLLPTLALQRAFALPLLLLTLWSLVAKRYAWVGISWIGAALLYPVVLPVQGLTAVLVFAGDLLRQRRMPQYWALNALLGTAALATAAFSVPIPPGVGPAFDYAQAIRMPEFGEFGRLVLYETGWVGNWLRGHRMGLGWEPEVLLLMSVGLVVALGLGRGRAVPPAAWLMAGVGCGLWVVMRLFPEQTMFDLYLPNRYSRWAVGIFGVFAIAAGALAALEWVSRRLAAPGESGTQRNRLVVGVATPVVVAIALLPNAASLWSRPVDRDLEAVYAFLATLPRDTLVAAHPDLADFIPVRSRRSVLASTETSMAWMETYYAQARPRLEASMRAAYATSIEEMDDVLRPFGVDVMVSGPPAWREARYFAPFDVMAEDLKARGAREGFALRPPPPKRVLFHSGDYYVVRVER